MALPQTVFLAVFLAWLAGCVGVDLRLRRIPWPLSYSGLLIGVWGAWLFPRPWQDWLLTFALFWLLPLVFWAKNRKGFGGADVRLLWALSLVSFEAALAGLVALGIYLLWVVLRRFDDPAALVLYFQNLLQSRSPDELSGPLVPMAPAVAAGAALYVLFMVLR